MTLRLNGSTSGYVELDAPAVAGTTALTLPDTSGTVATQAYADTAGATLGGLVHIATESFSAVSAISVNNCFTSTYENYLLLINFTNSAGAYIDFRLRASGADDSTANYSYQGMQANDTSVTAFRGSTQTSGELTYSQAQDGSAIVDFLSPQLAVPTKYFSRGNRGTTTPISMTYHGYHNVSSAFDGITVYPESGTFTGTIRVYGYLNS